MRDGSGSHASSQGLTLPNVGSARSLASIRSKLKNREITTRKQVGDAESMMNEEPAQMRQEMDS